jgi:hypothetical protein
MQSIHDGQHIVIQPVGVVVLSVSVGRLEARNRAL